MHISNTPPPGRLRLHIAPLKGRPDELSSIAATLRTVTGIVAVETSPITGSLLIHYDALGGKTMLFWDQVESALLKRQVAFQARPVALREQGGMRPAPSSCSCMHGKHHESFKVRRIGATHWVSRGNAEQPHHSARGSSPLPALRLVEGITSAALEKLLERSAIALVAALL
jgi:hypothetical protein